MSATIRQRRQLLALTGAASYAAHAALPMEQHTLASLRWEQQRATRLHEQLQADALGRRVQAAGEVGCAPVESQPSHLQRLAAALRAEYGRRWWLAGLAAALYFASGTAAGVAVVAAYAGWQP